MLPKQCPGRLRLTRQTNERGKSKGGRGVGCGVGVAGAASYLSQHTGADCKGKKWDEVLLRPVFRLRI